MKKGGSAAAVIGVCFLAVAGANATTVDITGQNSWTQGWDPVPLLVSDAMNYTPGGNASFMFDVQAGDPFNYPYVPFPSVSSGVLTFRTMIHVPSTSQGAFLMGLDDGVANTVQLSSYFEGSSGGWTQVEAPGSGATPAYTRDAWHELEYVVDFDQSTGTFYYDGASVGSGGIGTTSASNLWFFQHDEWVNAGIPFTGPIYLDDMSLMAGDAVFWSDNFDSYIAVQPPGGDVPEPATCALAGLALAGLAGYLRRRRC